jgi:hypothetical protein
MRRRVVPALIGLLAAGAAVWRRRAARTRPGLAEGPASGALAEPPRQLAPAAPDETSEPPAGSAPEPEEPKAAPEPPPRQPADGPRFVSVPWTLASNAAEPADPTTDGADLRELPIRFTLLGGRMALDRVDVRETESQVFVTVLARWDPPEPGRPWVPYGVAGETTVRLARPLGDRALVHAPDQLAELTGDGGPDAGG